MDDALVSENLYRVGIACHAYADTWAHQNFIGYYDGINSMTGLLEAATPNIGHADAGHDPDWPALVWKDRRLLGDNARVDNKWRFLDAAMNIFLRLRAKVAGRPVKQDDEAESRQMAADLSMAIGERDPSNGCVKERIGKYLQQAEREEYRGKALDLYDEDLWFEAAVNEKVRGLRDRSDTLLSRWDPLTDRYTWKQGADHTQSDWYRFQLAVKDHQKVCLDLLTKELGDKMDLEEF